MKRVDGIVVDYDFLQQCGAILVVEDQDFETVIRSYERDRLVNLNERLLYFKYRDIRHQDRFIFHKIKNKRINKFIIGAKANFDIDGNPGRPNLIVRINYEKKFKITSLYHFESKNNDQFTKRLNRVNQKVKHNLFNPWVVPFRH